MAKVLSVKIISGSGKQGSVYYKNKINLADFKQLALFFSDLEVEGAKIKEAFEEYVKNKESWPF